MLETKWKMLWARTMQDDIDFIVLGTSNILITCSPNDSHAQTIA